MPFQRTLLFAPGNHARRIEKALTLGADGVILDLEDSVPPAEKEATRASIVQALGRSRTCSAYVRVNAMGTPYCYGDLVAVVVRGADGIVLPKVESAADLHAIDWLIANLERERGLPVGSLALIPIIETAAGLARIYRILQARTLKPYSGVWRVRCVAFGAADYSHDLGLSPDEEETQLANARAELVLASRAAGMEGPLDSPWFRLQDLEGFRRSIERSRRSGFQGRLCIHPNQVPIANEGYAPSAEEIAQAERIVAAFRAAEASGAAAIQVDGQMIDYPVVQRAERLLKAARG
jgi:citrate lyase subunit beta/citryl-CoA lyase